YRDALYTDRRSNFTTAMAQFKPLNLTGRFALTFKKKIEKPSFLIKYGDKKGPIREEVDLRCETLDQHYNSSKPVDFVKGEHGDIIIERSSGLSFFSSIKKMPKSFRVTGRLWRLKCDSPFPDELQITYDQKLHGTILPSSEQNFKEEQLKEVNA
ncbi:unnamed protein product, partial [Porites lobata]